MLIIKDKRKRLIILCLLAVVLCAIAFAFLYKPINHYLSITLPEKREKEALRAEFINNPDIGIPGSIAFNGWGISGEPIVRMFRVRPVNFCEEYRKQDSVTIELSGGALTGKYHGYAQYLDGEIASKVHLDDTSGIREFGQFDSADITDDGKLRALTYKMSISSQDISEKEREVIARSIAEEILGELNGYTFTKHKHSVSNDNRSTVFLFAKYSVELILEDYVEVEFASYSPYLKIYTNCDDREIQPDINSEEAWEYICSRVHGVFEGNDTDQHRVECEKPYMVGLHKDSKGQWYVRGYVNVNYVYYATDDSAEKIEIHNEEFIVYLPEKFQS